MATKLVLYKQTDSLKPRMTAGHLGAKKLMHIRTALSRRRKRCMTISKSWHLYPTLALSPTSLEKTPKNLL